MLELSEEERSALTIVILHTSVRKETYGAAHQFNWKKVGLSRAYYKKFAVTEEAMPTQRAKAAFRYLMAHNRFYKVYQEYQREILRVQGSCNISSYDLFILQ